MKTTIKTAIFAVIFTLCAPWASLNAITASDMGLNTPTQNQINETIQYLYNNHTREFNKSEHTGADILKWWLYCIQSTDSNYRIILGALQAINNKKTDWTVANSPRPTTEPTADSLIKTASESINSDLALINSTYQDKGHDETEKIDRLKKDIKNQIGDPMAPSWIVAESCIRALEKDLSWNLQTGKNFYPAYVVHLVKEDKNQRSFSLRKIMFRYILPAAILVVIGWKLYSFLRPNPNLKTILSPPVTTTILDNALDYYYTCL